MIGLSEPFDRQGTSGSPRREGSPSPAGLVRDAEPSKHQVEAIPSPLGLGPGPARPETPSRGGRVGVRVKYHLAALATRETAHDSG
jgi:hypothetical protein